MAILFAKPAVKTEGTEAVATYEGNAFLDNTKLDVKVVKQVFKELQVAKKAIVDEAAETAIKTFKGNDKVERFVAKFNHGIGAKDTIEIVIDKEKEYHVPGSDKKVKNSAMVVKQKMPSMDVSKSSIKSKSKEIHESVC